MSRGLGDVYKRQRILEAVTRLPAGYCGSEVSVAPRGLMEKPKRQHRTVCADLGAD